MTENNHNHDKIYKEICDHLGSDVDSPMCQELKDHLDACPECKVFFDSIKKTVHLYRNNESDLKTPEKAKKNILKSINMELSRK